MHFSFRVPCPCGCPVRRTTLILGPLLVKWSEGLYVAWGRRYFKVSREGFVSGRS